MDGNDPSCDTVAGNNPGGNHRVAGDGDRRNDAGFATVWTAGAIAAVLVVMTVMMWLGAAIVTRHRAAAAADLAALAAAGRASGGVRSACRTATTVADHMHTQLSSCKLDGTDALVEITTDPGGVLADFGRSTAHARAGPVELERVAPRGRAPPSSR